MVIPDVNLLVYAYNGSVPQHEQAKSWWESLVRSGQGVGICWPVMQGVLRILTSRRILEAPYAFSEVFDLFESWWKQPNIELLSPSHATYKVFEELCRTTQVESALTTDALIAAFAIERKAQLACNDTDFLRFAGVRLVNPLQTKGRRAPRSSGR